MKGFVTEVKYSNTFILDDVFDRLRSKEVAVLHGHLVQLEL